MGIASGPDTPSPSAVEIIRHQLADLLSDGNACVMMALEGGTLAGIGIGRIEEEYGSRYGDFWDVVVKPEYGGKGIGGRLIILFFYGVAGYFVTVGSDHGVSSVALPTIALESILFFLSEVFIHPGFHIGTVPVLISIAGGVSIGVA